MSTEVNSAPLHRLNRQFSCTVSTTGLGPRRAHSRQGVLSDHGSVARRVTGPLPVLGTPQQGVTVDATGGSDTRRARSRGAPTGGLTDVGTGAPNRAGEVGGMRQAVAAVLISGLVLGLAAPGAEARHHGAATRRGPGDGV